MRCFLSVILTLLVGLPSASPLAAQRRRPPPVKLNIKILEGEGAVNGVRQRVRPEPTVQVEDENARPVIGAAVLFALPESGPGGAFANGSRSYLGRTDSAGRAVAKGLRANEFQGKFEIRVQASFQGVTATTEFMQVNALVAAARRGVSRKLIAVLAAAGAAAAAGVVIARRRSAESGGGGGVVITAGTPTIGGPQ